MNSIFWELLHEEVLANYTDNFIILAKTIEELEERMIRFLKIAEKHNLCFKRSKCDFNIEEISILGVIIGKGQIKMEQEKIKVVKEWKIPTKVKNVESFLGFTNFYQQFIQNFSHMAKLLNKLKSKKNWKWEEEHQKAFKELKEKIISQPVLALPRRERKFRVETDVSGHTIGGIERRQNGIHRRKNLYIKQQEDQRENPKEESQLSECGTSRTTQDAGITQKNLLVARIKGRYQKICPEIL